MPIFGWEIIAALAAVALVAGFIDSIAGGGGLLTLPALMMTGLDPQVALATNKLQGAFGSGSATLAFARARMIHWRTALPFAAIAAFAAIFGAMSARFLSVGFLQVLIPVLLLLVAIYFVLSPTIRDEDAKARLKPLAFAFTTPLAIGYYDGIFGPGAGSFYMLGFITLFGYGIVRATAHTKLLNFGSNLGSLTVFLLHGDVMISIGLAMAAGAFIGAQIGSRVAMRFSSRVIRPLLVIVCCAMAVYLLTKPDNPIRIFLEAHL